MSLEGNALTIGRAAVPAATVARLAEALAADKFLAIARGGGPLYFSVAKCKKADCFASQEL